MTSFVAARGEHNIGRDAAWWSSAGEASHVVPVRVPLSLIAPFSAHWTGSSISWTNWLGPFGKSGRAQIPSDSNFFWCVALHRSGWKFHHISKQSLHWSGHFSVHYELHLSGRLPCARPNKNNSNKHFSAGPERYLSRCFVRKARMVQLLCKGDGWGKEGGTCPSSHSRLYQIRD